MKGRTRYAAALLALLVAGAWWALREAAAPPPDEIQAGPTGSIRGFSLVEYDTGGAVVWTLSAARASETTKEVTVEAIRLEFPGETPTVLAAPRGRLDRGSRDITLTGGVGIDLADGGRVEAETATYVAAERRIVAPSPVRFESAGSWAEAETGVIDPKDRILRSRNARGLVRLEPR